MSQIIATPPDAGAHHVPAEFASLSFSYRELRSLAEYASSIRGEDAYFIRGDEGWKVLKSTDPVPAGAQPIHVYNPATAPRPRVVKAVIGADNGEEYDLMRVPDPRTNTPVEADAAFWSESAVEKFMVPYYASVYGDQAGVEVSKLLQVFNPGKKLAKGGQVVVLAHIPRSEYVTVGDEVAVVLVNRPRDEKWALTLQEHAEELQG